MRIFFSLLIVAACTSEPDIEPASPFEPLPTPAHGGSWMTFVFDHDGFPVAAGYDNSGNQREYFVHRFDGAAWTTTQVDAYSDVWAHGSAGEVVLTVNNRDIWHLERDDTWTVLPPHDDGLSVFVAAAGTDGTVYRGTDTLSRFVPGATAWELVDALPCSYAGRELVVEPDNTIWRNCLQGLARTRDGETSYAAASMTRLARGTDGMYFDNGNRVLRVDRETLDIVVVLELPFDESVNQLFDNGDGSVFAMIRQSDLTYRIDRLGPDGVVTIVHDPDHYTWYAASGSTLYKISSTNIGRLTIE